MSKARDLADFISTGSILSDGTIESTEISGVTATANELNVLDGITATTEELNNVAGVNSDVQTQLDGKQGVVSGVSDTEIGYLDGVTSNLQTQLDNISVTSGSLTKSFASGETASITLAQAISPAPVVSVTKEVPQTGQSSKGAWDVATDGANYDRHNTAYDTTLIPVTPYDYSSGTIQGAADINAEVSTPTGVAFSDDGSKYFVVDISSTVHEYSLSTAYDVDTQTLTTSFDASSQVASAFVVRFKTDGTKMYIGADAGTVYQYSLSTAWDVSTASYDSVNYDTSAQVTALRGVSFKPDGTAMYIGHTSGTTTKVFQYTLSTAWDVSTASYASKTVTLSTSWVIGGIDISPLGTTLLIGRETYDDIVTFSIATAWDISTLNTSGTLVGSTSLSNTNGVGLSVDGSRIAFTGNASGNLARVGAFNFTADTPFLTLGTGSFASTDVGKTIEGNGGEVILTATDGSYSVVTAFNDSSTIAAGSWGMYALTFDATNGVELSGFVEGASYSLSSYANTSTKQLANDGSHVGFAFNSDGTRVIALDDANNRFHQWDLNTPYDVSSSFSFSAYNVPTGSNLQGGPTFSPDGLVAYYAEINAERIYELTLANAFDMSNVSSYTSLQVTSQDNYPYAVRFNSDGSKMIMLGRVGGTGRLYSYNLSSTFDITSASYASVSITIPTSYSTFTSSTYSDFIFSSDGTKIIAVDDEHDNLVEFSLDGSPFDIGGGLTYSNVLIRGTGSGSGAMHSIALNSDGTTVFGLERSGTDVFQADLLSQASVTAQYSPAITNASGQIDTNFWTDINSMTADQTANDGEVYYAVSTDDRTTWSVIKDSDGVRPIVRDNAGTWEVNDSSTYTGTAWVSATSNTEMDALQEALTSAGQYIPGFDIENASYDSVSFNVGSQDAAAAALTFNNDGTKMYVTGYANDSVFQYTLSTAFDVSTASYDSVSLNVASQEGDVQSVKFNTNGTKMYITGSASSNVHQYTLSTAFDLSTASYDSVSFNVTQDNFPSDVAFNNDGTKMYVTGSSSDSVHEYTLSTAFDLSTASYNSVSFSVSAQDSSPSSIAFNSEGTKMYIVGDSVLQYSLSTAFDLSTASYDSVSFSVSGQETSPTGMAFNLDGTKMCVIGFSSDSIHQYSTTGSIAFLNHMNKTQLDAVTDPNHYTLGDSLDLMIALYMGSNGTSPTSDGVSINYDAEALNQGAVLGTDYDYDFPDSSTVRITSNAAQNLKVRVV